MLVSDFSMELQIQLRKPDCDLDCPNTQITGGLTKKLEINFTPYLFVQAVNLSKLLKSHETQNDFDRLKDASVQGPVKLQGVYLRKLQ